VKDEMNDCGLKTFNVTVNVVREYSATIKISARDQAEAEKIALEQYNRWRCRGMAHSLRGDYDFDSKFYDGVCLGFPPPWDEHESITYDPEINIRFHCVDCGKCTSSSGEYYMVDDDLWAVSGLEGNDGMLCLRCLEQRIGREPTIDDFTAIWPRREAWERHVADRNAEHAAASAARHGQLRLFE
jgi:hypothetical protein